MFPVLPDERLNRLKLISLELGVLALLAAVFARALAMGGLFRDASSKDAVASRWSIFYSAPAAVGVWLVINIVLAAVSADRALALSEINRVLLAAAGFVAFRYARLDDAWTTRVLYCWTGTALLTALYATLQQRGGIGVIQVPQMDRVAGTFGNPIFLSSYLVLSIFVATAARRLGTAGFARAFAFVSTVLIVPALAAAQTRAAYLGLAAAATAAVIFSSPARKMRMLTLAGVAIMAIGAVSFPLWTRDQAHFLIWRDTLRLFTAHPFTGVGLGAFHVHFPAVAQADLVAKWPKGHFVVNHGHNEYFQTLAEGGLFLGLSFIATFLVFFAGVWRRSSPDRLGAAAPLALGVLAVAVQNFFSVDMRFTVSLASVFIVMGLAASEGRVWPAPETPIRFQPIRIALAAALLLFAGWAGHRWIVKPHQDQHKVAVAPGFFDERLLEPAKTIGDLEALAEKYPEEPNIMEKLAFVCAKEMQRPDGSINREMTDRAVAAYRRVVALDPKRASAYNNLGNIYYTAGSRGEAIDAWTKAAELEPLFLDPRLNLGKALYLRGDLKESSEYFQAVLKIQPGHPEAALYLRRMVE